LISAFFSFFSLFYDHKGIPGFDGTLIYLINQWSEGNFVFNIDDACIE